MRWDRGNFTVTDCREDLDDELIYTFLSTRSYWAKGRPKDVVVKSLDHSLCFGLFQNEDQVGFGRVVTDRATFGYLADVFILEGYRGQGLGTWLVECMLSHPELTGLRRWMLATADAHQLYRQQGFAPLGKPEMLMERLTPEVYQRQG
ncbi:MAG: GNAT family N-acetyltransferase [Leptolyngbya sp. SIO1E4]|nr:GNAT family N-acetyltransferase [Leptolyngbya sp. SIO1E4]